MVMMLELLAAEPAFFFSVSVFSVGATGVLVALTGTSSSSEMVLDEERR